MSEEILRALTQLFAITTKQDGVSERERDFVINFFKTELAVDSAENYIELYDEYAGWDREKNAAVEFKAPSVKDSVKTLGLCKKVNKTLEQKQKVIVLMKMLEVVYSDGNFSKHEMDVINTISTVFNIPGEEYSLMEIFADAFKQERGEHGGIFHVDNTTMHSGELLFHGIQGDLEFLHLESVDMYFLKYQGESIVTLNNFSIIPGRVYLFTHGNTLRSQHGDVLYYSDLVSCFGPGSSEIRLSFEARINEHQFPNGETGLKDIHISEGAGKLVGIMGASGAGKTTLINVLAGLDKPTEGKILINGFDVYGGGTELEGVVGYVSQDDLLIEELTVYENLYFNTKLCFDGLNEQEINNRVMKMLADLDLENRRDLRVGSVLEKTISGGQRKRLNIALELIREPAILFLDEPTSGLSSRDSENVVDLLKELSTRGTLVFAVIHQPSSDIYKLFDRMYILDNGGLPIYYGDPVEAVTYFKTEAGQADRLRSQCELCGSINPEQIFNIVEAQVVDEYGQRTGKRKVSPKQWYKRFKRSFAPLKRETIDDNPARNLSLPSRIKQVWIFTWRDTLPRINNRQYLLINLLEAPLLAALLAWVIRYRSSPSGDQYIYRFNENIPAFLLMAIIVALFMGMTVSAEEILKDRKILKRESFLNLSWNSFLVSKLIILFSLSAVQTFSFVLIGNLILGMPGNIFSHWIILFSCSTFANLVGLNISSAFKNAVTIYILIPLLLIPQMIFSGVIFDFDKLNNTITGKGEVPVIADMMASRWAYEAYAVNLFIENDFEQPYYYYEKEESVSDIKASYVADILEEMSNGIDQREGESELNFSIIKSILNGERFRRGIEGYNLDHELTNENFKNFKPTLDRYIAEYRRFYQARYNQALTAREKLMRELNSRSDYELSAMKDKNFNESLSDLVRNIATTERVAFENGKFVQQIDPVFRDPIPRNYLDYRAHFFAPKKHFLGVYFNTISFNVLVIWLMTFLLYAALYFEWLRKIVQSLSRINFRNRDK